MKIKYALLAFALMLKMSPVLAADVQKNKDIYHQIDQMISWSKEENKALEHQIDVGKTNLGIFTLAVPNLTANFYLTERLNEDPKILNTQEIEITRVEKPITVVMYNFDRKVVDQYYKNKAQPEKAYYPNPEDAVDAYKQAHQQKGKKDVKKYRCNMLRQYDFKVDRYEFVSKNGVKGVFEMARTGRNTRFKVHDKVKVDWLKTNEADFWLLTPIK